jgi:hypothetical protein
MDIIKITDTGLMNAINMGLRLILLISGTSVMTLGDLDNRTDGRPRSADQEGAAAQARRA